MTKRRTDERKRTDGERSLWPLGSALKNMNIAELNKITSRLVKAGKGQKEVCISKDTFKHPLEPDGCTILPVEIAELKAYEMMDDDGGWTDDVKTSLVLFGVGERDERIYAEQRKLNAGTER